MPLMGSMVGNLIMMLVDRICLARYSNDALEASGPAIYTAMAIIGVFVSIVGFSRSFVAQAYGRAGHGEAARQAAVGILIGIALAAFLLLMAPLLRLIPFMSNRPFAVTQLESQFLYWAAYFGCVMTLNVALSSYFNGIGKTRITLVVGLIGQAVVIFMTIGLVFGKFGLPELGMRGSALGTLTGTLAMFGCYVWFMPSQVWSNLKALIVKRSSFVFADAFPRIRKSLALGAATGVENFGSVIFIWLIGGLGSISLAANNVNITVSNIGIIPLIGLSIGCSVLCGNAIGEGDFPKIPRILFVTMVIEFIYIAIISYFQIFTPDALLNPFGLADRPEIHRAAIETSRVLWFYSLAFAFSITGGAVLESFGLTRFILAVRLIFMWALSIPIVYALTTAHSGNADFLPRCWVVGSMFEGIIGALYFWRILAAVKKRQNGIVLAYAHTPELMP